MIETNKYSASELALKCYHCGLDCKDDSIHINDKLFCCNGCKTVFEILEQNELCDYYVLDENPGISKDKSVIRNYDYLDDIQLKAELLDFTDGNISKITFSIPQMHCSSCIWILENLFKINYGIKYSKVNFLKKIVTIQFAEQEISLKQVVELLDSIGYQPDLNLEGKRSFKSHEYNKNLYYRIGVAGFAFGNIMLLSFPEYFSAENFVHDTLKNTFNYLNIILSLPVFFYSANEYFISAYKGLRNKIFNIDIPVSLGIIALFIRSLIEILTKTGPGYLDSMTALVFLLLVGKIFQNKTYDALNFERDYKSYFPIAITVKKNGKETTKPVGKLKIGDRIVVKNSELIPADSILINGNGYIDYSFVTGESTPVERLNGEIVFAGGRQKGSAIEVETIKAVSQSYLTQLWNNQIFDKHYKSRLGALINPISKYFTFAILLIACTSAIYWFPNGSLAFNAFTAVLIIACPCALALSTPFTLGNTLRILGKNKFYIKNTDVIERLASVSHIVFDKTGTLTKTSNSEIKYEGEQLSDFEKGLVKTLVQNSSHPLSKGIYKLFDINSSNELFNFEEIPSQGLKAIIDNNIVQIGSKIFVCKTEETDSTNLSTKVYLSINGKIKGFFGVKNIYRENVNKIIYSLAKDYKLSLLSGDNDGEKKELSKIFPQKTNMLFNQSPQSKLNFVKHLQEKNNTVLMFGDGLNDAGALKQSDVGIAISENTNNFSPACDGILESSKFDKLYSFIHFAKSSRNIIIVSFIISFLYNIIGLSFAVQGNLSPVIAAILMPLSSISVVAFTTLTVNILATKQKLI